MEVNSLIQKLQKRFENKLPIDVLTDTELARLIGQQDVINYILEVTKYLEQEELKEK